MRPLGLLPLLLAGCLWGGGEASRVEDLGAGARAASTALPAAPDRHRYGDPAALKPGQWATYREGERTVTLAVVAEEGGALWIEVIDEGEPRLVSSRLTTRDGEVLKAFGGEAGGPASPQRLVQAPGAPPAEAAEERVSDATLAVSGRTLACRSVVRRREDLEGRVTEESSLWSAEAPPLYAGSPHGGLVRRTSPAPAVELLRWGTDAKPSLAIPR